MNARDQAPRLQAWAHPDGTHWLVWCQWCGTYHWHSVGTGHRAAHCGARLVVRGRRVVDLAKPSPYRDSGYTLVGGERAPPVLVKDARRKRPVGPLILLDNASPPAGH